MIHVHLTTFFHVLQTNMASLYSFSFQSTDCCYVSQDGSYVFQMNAHAPRMQASRVSLGTLELPLAQLPVEKDWNKVYFSEGFALTPASRKITLSEFVMGVGTQEYTMIFPIYSNLITNLVITEVAEDGSFTVECETEQPHGLWPGSTDSSIAGHWTWDPIRIIGSSLGDIYIGTELTFVDETTFSATGAYRSNTDERVKIDDVDTGGYLHAPRIPGPLQMARLVEMALAYMETTFVYHCYVDATSGGLVVSSSEGTSTVAVPSVSNSLSVSLTLSGDILANLLGVQNVTKTWNDNSHMGLATSLDPTENWTPTPPRADHPSAVRLNSPTTFEIIPEIPSFSVGGNNDFVGGVGVGELPVGWYDISVRPVGALSRHSISASWGMAIQPLYLPSPSKPLVPTDPQTGEVIFTPYFINFTTPLGLPTRVGVPMGNYTPETLCYYLNSAMQGVNVSFTRDKNMNGRFTFCTSEKYPSPSRFTLDFASGMASFDPAKLGFDRVLYSGSNSYTSPKSVLVASMTPVSQTITSSTPPRGVWGIEILGDQRRLQLTCNPQSVLYIHHIGNGLCGMYDMTGHPWVHGYVPGDLIQLQRSPVGIPAQLCIRESTGSTKWAPNSGDESSSPITLTTMVVPLPEGISPLIGNNLINLSLPETSLLGSNNWFVVPSMDIYPSLFFGRKNSIPQDMLGLPSSIPTVMEDSFFQLQRNGVHVTALVWGLVGDVAKVSGSNSIRKWPLSSWAIYRFDPPEIVLIYFNKGRSKQSSFLQNVTGSNVTIPFARLNLGSIHREGALKSEILNMSQEPLTLFEIKFCNPDGTNYNMHNSTFTFALNVITGNPQ